MFNKLTNKIDLNERLIQMQDWIIEQISNQKEFETLKNYNKSELLNNLFSPSSLRLEILEKTIERYFFL